MEGFNYIDGLGSALIGAVATIVVGYFTLRSQFRDAKNTKRNNDNNFILELQKQLATEREQMNEQRIQDTKAIGENLSMISTMQREMSVMREEMGDWRSKYFDLNEKYNQLQSEYNELQKKFSALKGSITKMKNGDE